MLKIALVILGVFLTAIFYVNQQYAMIVIFPLVCIVRNSLRKSDSERIYAIQHGVRGTAILWNCPSYKVDPSSTNRTYTPVFSFSYAGKVLYREPWGLFDVPPCNIGDIMNVVYCAETDWLVLMKKEEEKIYTIQHGVRGSGTLCDCPSYEGDLSEKLQRMFRPVFSFSYDGKDMCKEAFGAYYEPPGYIGDIMEIVYCAETDRLVLIDEDYDKYINPNTQARNKSTLVDAMLGAGSVVVTVVLFYCFYR